MFYRTNDFRINVAIGCALICAAAIEGETLLENVPISAIMSIGLASIASLGTFIALIELAVINKIEASLINEKISYGLLPILFTTVGTLTHACFYLAMLNKGIPFREIDPLLKTYFSFCIATVIALNLYYHLTKHDSKRYAR